MIFISFQSYGNSLPQSRHETYVPVREAASECRCPGLLVIGKLNLLCVHPNRTSRRFAIFTTHPSGSLETDRRKLLLTAVLYNRTCPFGQYGSYPSYPEFRFRVAGKGSQRVAWKEQKSEYNLHDYWFKRLAFNYLVHSVVFFLASLVLRHFVIMASWRRVRRGSGSS